MRHIQKKNEPQSLTQWRAAYQNDPNFGYLLIEASLRGEIRQALVAEQGGLCAYTGRRINETSCHIEHPKPQAHCLHGEDVSFANMRSRACRRPMLRDCRTARIRRGRGPMRQRKRCLCRPFDRAVKRGSLLR